MRSEIEKCESLDKLFELWQEEEIHKGKVFVSDGFVDENVWNSSEYKKILFVLKEAYGNIKNGSITDWLAEREKHPKMWKRVIEWIYGINNTNENYIGEFPSDLFDDKKGTSTEVAVKLLKSIAIMNLKKSDGKSHTDMSELNKYAKTDSEFLKKQIEFISPDIIVCGSTLTALDNGLYNGQIKKKKKNDDWFYYANIFPDRETLIIDYYHPAARRGNKRKKYNRLTECYQKALLSKIKK